MIEIKDLSLTFKNADEDHEALKAVTLDIPEGCIYGFVGSNGADLKSFYQCSYPTFDDKVFDDLISKLDLPRKKPLSQFSKGMKRQAIVACALASRTKYILLDEAFDGLDPAMRKLIRPWCYPYRVFTQRHRDRRALRQGNAPPQRRGHFRQGYRRCKREL